MDGDEFHLQELSSSRDLSARGYSVMLSSLEPRQG